MGEGPGFASMPSDGDELLDERPDRPRRRGPMVVIAVGLVVAAIVVAVNSHSSSRPDARPSPSVSITPVIPEFATSAPGTVAVTPIRTPGQCPADVPCVPETTTPAVTATVTAAIRAVLGAPTRLRITALRRSSAVVQDDTSGLFSRTVTADVPAGTLRLLVSVSGDDAVSLPSARGGATLCDGFVDGYYVHAVVVGTSREREGTLLLALTRLVQDERLVTP